jgi:hypothetical protein
MSRIPVRVPVLLGAAVVASGMCSMANAQLAPTASMPDELAAQYKVSKLAADSTGTVVTDAGTVLDVQKGGILGFDHDTGGMIPTKYEKGSIHSPNGFAMLVLQKKGGVNTKFFTVGEKVYVTKIDVQVKNEKVVLSLVECDTCNNVQNPSGYKAQLQFQFDKGFLETATAAQVEDTIGQVLSIDNGSSDSQQANNAQGGQQQGGQGGGQQGGGQQAPAQAAPPASIELGQTTDQVVAALGDPQKIVKLGTKQIYVYKDLKVTFTNGKVSDVQ